MINSPELLAELDHLTLSVLTADMAIVNRLNSGKGFAYATLAATREDAEERLFAFAKLHGLNACVNAGYLNH